MIDVLISKLLRSNGREQMNDKEAENRSKKKQKKDWGGGNRCYNWINDERKRVGEEETMLVTCFQNTPEETR